VLSARDAADLIRTRDTLALPLGPGQPPGFLHALGERDDFRELRVFTALLTGLYKIFTRPGVTLLSGFFGPVERGLRAAGHDVRFVPGDFRGLGAIAARMRPRVMATLAAPPDARGRLNLSLHAGATVEALQRCGRDPERLLIVEVNPRLPRTVGFPPLHPHSLALDEVDVIVENDAPVFTLPDPNDTPIARTIASHARRFIEDGSTLQTGIGEIPNDVAALLAEGDGGDYGIHTEMFTTGLMRLHQSGKVTNRKGIFDGVSVATFAAGTPALYAWLDGNEAVRFLPVDRTNTPSIIARNRKMVSINGALCVDLAGQVAADTLGTRQYSGIGGHEDFVAGAGATGRSLVCLPSVAENSSGRHSRILAAFEPGTMVTTPRHHVDVVVTEWGAAELQGRTVEERAQALAEIAHPDFREALRVAAKERRY
jgi:acyl-CoA hydrolase